MNLDEIKDALLKISMGRRDAVDDLAEFLHELAQPKAEPEPKPKKAAK